MRIWDVPPEHLCRAHLLGEHRELHGLWNIITEGKKGYSQHPETKRWDGKQAALFKRHEALVSEMHRRGYGHYTALDPSLATGRAIQDTLVHSVTEQIEILHNKPCSCYL